MKNRPLLLYILIFFVLALVVWIVFVFFPSSSPDTVEVVLPTDSPDDGDGSGKDEEVSPIIEINSDTVQTMIATLSRANSYSRTLSIERWWNGNKSTETIDVWVRGDETKMAISSPVSAAAKYILVSGDEKWIWYSGSDDFFSGPAAETDADRYQSLISYESVLELPTGDIYETGYTEINGETCISLRCRGGELDYDNVFYVSTESGLLVTAESYDGDELIYSMSSTLPDYADLEDAVFAPPSQQD